MREKFTYYALRALFIKMKHTRKLTAFCLLPSAFCLLLSAFCLLPSAFCFLLSESALAQEISPDSLNLPEVVITGTDQTKIQRQLPTVTLQSSQLVVKESSRDVSDSLLQAGDLLYLANPQKAETRYTQAVAIDPAGSQAYLRLGDVYRALNQYSIALEAYQKALKISKNLPDAHYKLGILYESQFKNLDKAIEHYQAYLQRGGSDSRVRIWLRNTRRQQKQQHAPQAVEEAIE